jgi:STE24 endopeptidase
VDFLKEQALALVIGGGVILLFLFMYQKMGNSVFIAFFFVLIAFQLFMAFISPFLIRIFNRLTPIEDGELKCKIEELTRKSGYKIKGIYMVDASKRSTELNAFATGFGKTKTIGLYDTLKEKMTDDEIVSILAHEIGHIKKHHVLKSTPLMILLTGLGFLAAYFIVAMPSLSLAFGFEEANIVFGILIMMVLISPIMILLKIPLNFVSRKHEYEADRFEKEMMGKAISVSAMKKLYREDLGNLTPHPFVVMLSHSHPTASQRIATFENDDE